MRRKLKNKRFFLRVSLIVLISISIVGVGYSYFAGSLNISGEVTGYFNDDYTILPESDPNLEVTLLKSNSWQEKNRYKFQYTFSVKNIGQEQIDNFVMTLAFLNKIESVSIWNYDYELSGKTLSVINNNHSLDSQKSITVDFIIDTKSSNQTLKTISIEVDKNGNEVSLDDFLVNFEITGEWGQYTYQYNVVVTNQTGVKINAWQLDVILPERTSFVSGWNAIYSFNNNILTIKNESYNGRLKNSESTSLGLQLSTNIINFIPSDIKVTVR